MSPEDDLSPEVEHRHHDYVGNRIPWFVRAFWIAFWIFAAWFGYDAFLNSDEHMQEPFTLWFNRIGFPIATLFALRLTWTALRQRD